MTSKRKTVFSAKIPTVIGPGSNRVLGDGDPYRFWVVGPGSSGYKRDPYARELAGASDFPDCVAVLRASDTYPWHDGGFRTPDFSDMVIYQAHIGTYAVRSAGVASNFLDVAAKVPYLAALGINLLQPLPIDEQEASPSLGYGGADLFSPDFPYVANTADLPVYLSTINGLLHGKRTGAAHDPEYRIGTQPTQGTRRSLSRFRHRGCVRRRLQSCGRLYGKWSAGRQLHLLF